jgi:subfamily B ATP-binding cassette protein MsbA
MSPNRLLLSYALRYPGWILLTVLLGFSSAIFNGVSITLIVPLILGFLGKENVDFRSSPPILQKLLSLFDQGEGSNRLLVMVIVVVLAIVLKNVANYVTLLASSDLSRKLVNDIRKEGVKLLLGVDLDYFVKTKIGDVVNQISHEVGRAAGAIRIAIQIFTTLITILTFVVILISISWQLTLASTGLLFLVTLTNQYFIKRAKDFGQVLSDKSRDYSTAYWKFSQGYG